MTSTATTGAAQEETIFKTDALGRVKVPAVRREALLDEFERSGASGPAFARLVGIKYQTLATWMQARRRARRPPALPAPPAAPPTAPAGGPDGQVSAPAAIRWLEAVVRAPAEPAPTGAATPDAGALTLTLPGGVRLEITSAAQAPLAAALLRALAPKD